MSAIEVTSLAGLAMVQDGGRPGRMHEGIPPGGALVPEALARANGAVGNARDAAGIELVGSMGLVARGGTVKVATEDGAVRTLAEGEALRVEGRRELRVRYVAVRGGVDVPRVLGGRGTLRVAGVGGMEGRGLRKGDRIEVGGEGNANASANANANANANADGNGKGNGNGNGLIRVVVGPDEARFGDGAVTALLEGTFVISASSDRTGTRLHGPRLLRHDGDDASSGVDRAAQSADAPSAPMVAGAIEVPASGDPIVLGPDHPTTGGYPVLAVVVRADLGRFHALPIGAPVRFSRAAARVT